MKSYRIKRDNKHSINPEEILLDKIVYQTKEDGFAAPEKLETTVSNTGIWIITVIGLVLVGVFLFKSFYVQVIKKNYYINLSEDNRSRYTLERAPRGIIYDRYGKALVSNQESYSLVVIPADLPNDIDAVEATVLKIGQIFNLDNAEIMSEVKDKINSTVIDPILIKSNLDLDQVRKFETELQDKNGFSVIKDVSRAYDNGPVFASVLGYVGKISQAELKKNSAYSVFDIVGKLGLESYYEQYLKGKSGRHIVEINSKGQIVNDLGEIKSEPGDNITTTIDKDMQEAFYKILVDATSNLGITKAAGVALNPKTGEVLSLISLPSYDNNVFAKGGPKQEVDKILTNQDQPLYNRIISGLYSPGSTIKPLMALAALAEKIISPDKLVSDLGGELVVPNPYNPDSPSIFHDWKEHGMVNMYTALAYSCNVYFYELGGGYNDFKGLGVSLIKKYWQKLGFDKTRGIDLYGEKSGTLPDPDWIENNRLNDPVWHLGDTYNISIGQGDLALTPLQIITYIGAIANNGVMMKPYLVKTIIDKDNGLVKQNNPQSIIDLHIDAKELKVVQEGMREVITIGSANSLESLPMKVAGKTGTPQIAGGKKINAFFVAYAPYEDPDIVVLVLLEEPKEGSVVAIPVAKQLFQWYAQNRLNLSVDTQSSEVQE